MARQEKMKDYECPFCYVELKKGVGVCPKCQTALPKGTANRKTLRKGFYTEGKGRSDTVVFNDLQYQGGGDL